MRRMVKRKYQHSKNKMSQVFSAHDTCYIFSKERNKFGSKQSSILPKKKNKEKILCFKEKNKLKRQ